MNFSVKNKPTVFIIFGGTGDLAWRKLVPAIYNLYLDDWMPEHFAVIGNGRSELTDDDYREKLHSGIDKFSRRGAPDKKTWKAFSDHIYFQSADIKDPKTFKDLEKRVNRFKKEWGGDINVIFYLAVAPRFFSTIAEHVAKTKLASDKEHTRIVIEKPFGHDLESARELNGLLCSMFDESQIYRIDHYLGKETVQNIMTFRFANAIMEPVWNRNYIDHVQISVSEQLGVGTRGGYYDEAGALRDMVQNHLLQLLCLVAMEPPVNFDADEVRNRKVDVLRAIRQYRQVAH
ncbi:MAG: glucose-6-phosphate dehydrogenase, partial [Cyclobacteriaceae bacterium]